jgi:hypothetical protein
MASRRSARRGWWATTHVPTGGKAPVPAINDEFRLKAHSAVRHQLGGTSLDVEPSCPDAHRASIEASVSGVDPALRLPAHQQH